MASTNKTPNYNLSQFIATDKPAWLTDVNGDMSKIDTAIKGVSDRVGVNETAITEAEANIEDNASNITTLQASSSQHGTDITDLKAQDIIIKNDVTNLGTRVTALENAQASNKGYYSYNDREKSNRTVTTSNPLTLCSGSITKALSNSLLAVQFSTPLSVNEFSGLVKLLIDDVEVFTVENNQSSPSKTITASGVIPNITAGTHTIKLVATTTNNATATIIGYNSITCSVIEL